MKPSRKLFTLDEPVPYEIRVCGHIRENWSDWIEGTVTLGEAQEAGIPVGVITGTFDQAALHGLLRRLYSLGFPLMAVNWVSERHCGDQE